MPTELEELVGFMRHGNTQIRQIAVDNLVGYSTSEPAIFKANSLEPINDLKLLVKDYDPIAKNALIILTNLCNDSDVVEKLAEDDALIETLLLRLTTRKSKNADDIAMLFANLAKSRAMLKILKLQRKPPEGLSTSDFAVDQVMDCFVKGANGSFNPDASFDYLSYFFADLSQFPECRDYFTTPQARDEDIVPLSKLVVFTETTSAIRRRGVASTIKNVAFKTEAHSQLIASSGSGSVNLFPYLLMPIMGPEEYSLEDTEGMLEDVQLLPPDKERERDREILKTHLETLLLLATTREGRDHMRQIRVYPIVRETHSHVEDEEVREVCDRIVQIIMRDEEGEGKELPGQAGQVKEIEDEEDQIVDVI